MLLLVLLCLTVVNTVRPESYQEICIDQDEGEDNHTCFDTSSKLCCQNLGWVLSNMEVNTGTKFVFSEGSHILSGLIPNLQNLESLVFEGNNSEVYCQKESGLGFINVTKVTIKDVKFHYCGAARNSTSKRFKDDSNKNKDEFKVAIYFESSSDIVMENVVVQSSPDATGVVMYNVSGENEFKNCEFNNNSVKDFYEDLEKKYGGGGGGVYIELVYCTPGESCDSSGSPVSDVKYSFSNCHFYNNVASNWMDKGAFIYPYNDSHQAFGRGGGLSLFIKGNNNNIALLVEDCEFVDNVAMWGAGMFVELNDKSHNNTISVRSSKFEGNLVPIQSGGGGGGLRIAHYIYGSIENSNSFEIDSCIFTDNRALNGGGMSLSWAKHYTEPHLGSNFKLSNLTFSKNIGRLGSALYIEQFWKRTRYPGLDAIIDVINCTFLENSFTYLEKSTSYELGIGSFYISSSNISVKGTIIFQSNFGSALALSDSTILMENCYSKFTYNQGNIGAAIAVLGSSTIDVGIKTEMTFSHNTAVIQGGAIYIEYVSRQTRLSDPNCFLRHVDPFLDPKNWSISMVFLNNTDHNGSKNNSIHATSILPCSDAADPSKVNETFCWEGWEYDDENCSNFISSDIGEIINNDNQAEAVPGWPYNLNIEIKDDLNHVVHRTDILFSLTQLQALQNNCNNSNNILCDHNVTFFANPQDCSELNFNLIASRTRVWLVKKNVTLKSCPRGFLLDDNTLECKCIEDSRRVNCKEPTRTVRIARDTWIGKTPDDSKFHIYACPYHYCATRNESYTILNEDTEMCSEGRDGVICGECKPGYGVAVNDLSFDCIECNITRKELAINVIKYVASVYVPLAVVFTAIIVFDIRLTTGPANAFILYSQLVTTTFKLDADGGIPISNITGNSNAYHLSELYRIPYDIFNLNIIANYLPNFCFSSKMDTPSVLCLQYGVAIFPLVMIGVILAVLKVKDWCLCTRPYCTSDSRLVRFIQGRVSVINNALLPSFASFVLLSYTKFSTVSYLLMNTVKSGDNVRRLYLDAQYDSKSIEYKAYMSTGIAMLTIFTLATPVILLDFPLRVVQYSVSKSQFLSRIYPATTIHILLDTFQGCYKKNTRFFAGLYFLCRLAVTVSYAYCDTWLQRFVIQQLIVTFIIVLLAIFKPYRSDLNFVNYVDILIFSNLALLNCLSFYLYVFFDRSYSNLETKFVFYFQYIAVFFPLIYMACYIIWCLWKNRRTNVTQSNSILEELDTIMHDRHPTENITSTDIIAEVKCGTDTDRLVLLSNGHSTHSSKDTTRSDITYGALRVRDSSSSSKGAYTNDVSNTSSEL